MAGFAKCSRNDALALKFWLIRYVQPTELYHQATTVLLSFATPT